MESIRKISVGNDYKNAMNYLVGQPVLKGEYVIEEIQNSKDVIKIWIRNNEKNEIVCWKSFNKNMPISFEYNIDF
jgi:hypothetical protein